MYGQQDKFSQASTRSFRRFTDQHGRKWEAVVEKETQHPTGPIRPVNWTDQLNTPDHPQYIRIVKEEEGDVIRIDYDKWLSDRGAALDLWQQNFQSIAVQMYGDKAFEVMQKPTAMLMEYAGKKPKPIEQIKAAQAGNKWVLGIKRPDGTQYPKPEWANEFFLEAEAAPVQEFSDIEFTDDEKPKKGKAA